MIVSFDLDGTLIDSVADLARALNSALAELGLAPHPLERVRTFVGSGARNLVLRALTAHGRPELVDDALARFRHAYEQSLLTDTVVFGGVLDALDAITPHAQLVVCTNKPGVYARPLVAALLPGRIVRTWGPDDVSTLKPDPAMLGRAESELKDRVVAHVGDSAVDVDTALAHGCRAIAVTWGLSPRAELLRAHTLVDRVGDLPGILLPLLNSSSGPLRS